MSAPNETCPDCNRPVEYVNDNYRHVDPNAACFLYAARDGGSRITAARAAHRGNDPRAGIRAYCAGNKWLTENAKAVGNW